MAVTVELDVMLARRKMSVGDFANAVGITPANVAEVIRAGATAPAVISAIVAAPDIAAATAAFRGAVLAAGGAVGRPDRSA